MLPVAVLCGGRGTRLAEITGGQIPKALVEVAGRPFIQHKIENLATAGFRDVVLLVGEHADQIRATVGDGRHLGATVRYVDDGGALLGTGGAVAHALDVLPEAFWVTYGDTLLELDVAGAERMFDTASRKGLMTVLHNFDRWVPSNVTVADDRVTAYAKDPSPPGAEYVDYGMLLLTSAAFVEVDARPPFDLSVVLERLVGEGSLLAFEVHERFYEIGTADSLAEVERHVRHRQSGTS